MSPRTTGQIFSRTSCLFHFISSDCRLIWGVVFWVNQVPFRLPAQWFMRDSAWTSTYLYFGIDTMHSWQPVSLEKENGSRPLALQLRCFSRQSQPYTASSSQQLMSRASYFLATAHHHTIYYTDCNFLLGAVDMDIYRAFQICAIGLVAAPITILLHPAYFHDLGRKTIFLWTYFILAGKWFVIFANTCLRTHPEGLVSLSVEFHRGTPVPCRYDDSGNPISPIVGMFPYGNATCGLTCSVDNGPYSPIRSGSTNNIYVVPAPSTLTSHSAILLAVASCGPAIIMIFVMFNGISIFEENGKTRIDDTGEKGPTSQIPAGSSSATSRGNVKIITLIRRVPKAVRYLPFIGTALNILIAGEINFFSPQIRYQNEPISSIGK